MLGFGGANNPLNQSMGSGLNQYTGSMGALGGTQSFAGSSFTMYPASMYPSVKANLPVNMGWQGYRHRTSVAPNGVLQTMMSNTSMNNTNNPNNNRPTLL